MTSARKRANEKAKAKAKAKARVTSSATRAARSKASSSKASSKTTSSGKPAGRNPNVDNRAQRSRVSTAKVTTQKPKSPSSTSTAKVTSSASRDAGPSRSDAKRWQSYQKSAQTSGRGWKGAPGTADAPKNATGSGARRPGSQIAANKMTRALKAAKTARQAAATAGKVAVAAKAGAIGAAAYAGLQRTNTADGTLKGKPTGPAKGPGVPKRLTQSGVDKMKFDDAFRQARKSGAKTFNWRGKKYTTEVK
jgi:hypothetical protein